MIGINHLKQSVGSFHPAALTQPLSTIDLGHPKIKGQGIVKTLPSSQELKLDTCNSLNQPCLIQKEPLLILNVGVPNYFHQQ